MVEWNAMVVFVKAKVDIVPIVSISRGDEEI
jgi:hypothetical protein